MKVNRQLPKPALGSRTRALVCSCLVLATAAGATALGTTAAAARSTPTRAQVYEPFTAGGRPAFHVTKTSRGYCFVGSIGAARADAWRCFVGNYIHDPCFSSAKAAGFVLCPSSGPWSSSLLKIQLTRRLPTKDADKGKPSVSGEPWALETVTGWKCEINTGTGAMVDGQVSSYYCTNSKNWLWGFPSRKTKSWTIFAAPLTAKKLTKRVSIKAAWF